AHGYGSAETMLREPLERYPDLLVVTKLPALSSLDDSLRHSPQRMLDLVWESFSRLGRASVGVLLAHSASDLTGSNASLVLDTLTAAYDDGLAARIGFSAYDEAEIVGASGCLHPDVVQAPANVYDQRLAQGQLESLADEGTEVHMRSPYLQGLILQPSQRLPNYFQPIQAHQLAFHDACADHGVTAQQACLAFVNQLPGVAKVVVGVTSLAELDDACDAIESSIEILDWRGFALADLYMIDPRRWPRAATLR
ncbi:MAG: aldo/keto reductase, partial [Actinomycetes bacterium]